ncbi:bifunctional Citrate synthase/Citrate synthase-like [Babesia duncani]|uniref:Citrate synthase n=1 Tax=Babesia duncani TaxID=323732 RepID=A0AAD9PJ05_9APIC|nr:bifunctional Citrate synthase/Citrate synthase-like [Babesia duncani]
MILSRRCLLLSSYGTRKNDKIFTIAHDIKMSKYFTNTHYTKECDKRSSESNDLSVAFVKNSRDLVPNGTLCTDGFILTRSLYNRSKLFPFGSNVGNVTFVPHRDSLFSEAKLFSTSSNGNSMKRLYDRMDLAIARKRQQLNSLKTDYGNVKIGDVTISSVINGMRDIIGLTTETSELDANFGIRIRGYTIEEMLNKLPRLDNCTVPLVEGGYWLLLTGEIPTLDEVCLLSRELLSRAKLPHHVYKVLDTLPTETHPMTQLIVGVVAMQTTSVFRSAYNDKTFAKDTCWRLVLEDSLDLIARNLLLVGYIYRRCFIDSTIRDGAGMHLDPNLDYGANLAKLLGNNTPMFQDLMRLYLLVHTDHEAGNVSAHVSHVIGSSLADPYFCFAGALGGLSGPLHGMANQECLKWIQDLVASLKGSEPTLENVEKFAKDCLSSGSVIPGYGHAVLRVVDPRHTAFMKFAHANFPQDPIVKVLDLCLEAIPKILKATGEQLDFILIFSRQEMFTVFFGTSRALGLMSQLVWARALKFPIERPKSYTMDFLESLCKAKKVES